jgi:hypothetical protein
VTCFRKAFQVNRINALEYTVEEFIGEFGEVVHDGTVAHSLAKVKVNESITIVSVEQG